MFAAQRKLGLGKVILLCVTIVRNVNSVSRHMLYEGLLICYIGIGQVTCCYTMVIGNKGWFRKDQKNGMVILYLWSHDH